MATRQLLLSRKKDRRKTGPELTSRRETCAHTRWRERERESHLFAIRFERVPLVNVMMKSSRWARVMDVYVKHAKRVLVLLRTSVASRRVGSVWRLDKVCKREMHATSFSKLISIDNTTYNWIETENTSRKLPSHSYISRFPKIHFHPFAERHC